MSSQDKTLSPLTSIFLLAIQLFFSTITANADELDSRVVEAIDGAAYIALAEAGVKEFDNLKEGEIRKSTNQDFWLRKQAFKILKIYRDRMHRQSLQVGKTIRLNAKANICLGFPITVQRKGNELILTPERKGGRPNSEPIGPASEKVFLTLCGDEYNPKAIHHYGLWVSPIKYARAVEAEVIKKTSKKKAVPPATKKRVFSGCN